MGPDTTALVESTLQTARETLGMEMAYLADTREGLQDYRVTSGDAASFGVAVGEPVPLEGTYCALVLAGELDGLVADAVNDERVRDLAITRRLGIGSYVGVPVTLPDGGVYGTFCCLSHGPDGAISERDMAFVRALGRLLGEQIHRDEVRRAAGQRQLRAGEINALLAALEARDGYTGEHSEAVVSLALRVAREAGVAARDLDDVEAAALLHDIGKIGVSDFVLRKPGRLTEAESDEMRRHPEIGERIVASMDSLAHLAQVIRAEHERWDGGGYPDGLRGTAIPLIARIVFVCDAFHAMTSDRPYRRAIPASGALEELRRHAGTQFCPATVAAAERVLTRNGSAASG